MSGLEEAQASVLSARAEKVRKQKLLDTALREACLIDDVGGALVVLEAGANIEKSADGRQPLYIAAEHNSLGVATLLAEKGASMEGCKKGKRTALNTAVAKRHSAMVTLLVRKGADVNANALYNPACYADQSMCLLLISLGADPAITNKDDESALTHYGIYADPQLSSAVKAARINELVAARAKYLRASKCLIKACATDDPTRALAALEDGADVEYEHNGLRPLFIAALLNSIKVASILAEKGASMEGCKRGGDPALHAAAASRHIEMIKLLSLRGADMNAPCKDYASILHYPALRGDAPDICLLLVSLGSDPSIKDKSKLSALTHYGCGANPPLARAVKAARVAELVAARAEYVERARRQANWNRRRSAMLFLQGSGFRPSETQLAVQRLEQQHVDKHAHIQPTVLDTKEKRLAYLVSLVLSQEGISRNVVSFL